MNKRWISQIGDTNDIATHCRPEFWSLILLHWQCFSLILWHSYSVFCFRWVYNNRPRIGFDVSWNQNSKYFALSVTPLNFYEHEFFFSVCQKNLDFCPLNRRPPKYLLNSLSANDSFNQEYRNYTTHQLLQSFEYSKAWLKSLNNSM